MLPKLCFVCPECGAHGERRDPLSESAVHATVASALTIQAAQHSGVIVGIRPFDGAGHGFLRQQDGRDGANLAASQKAWPATIAFFKRHLGA